MPPKIIIIISITLLFRIRSSREELAPTLLCYSSDPDPSIQFLVRRSRPARDRLANRLGSARAARRQVFLIRKVFGHVPRIRLGNILGVPDRVIDPRAS